MLITLASTSKFKNAIMDKTYLKHLTLDPKWPEKSNQKDYREYVKELALNKAKSIINDASTDIVIGLDTIVIINNKIYEKPKSREEAYQNLKDASNNTSIVLTGIAIIDKKKNIIINDIQETKIKFRNITNQDIEFYLNNEKDYMYASGFIFETVMANFLDKIEGSYYNIQGVPVEKIYYYLQNLGYSLDDINK